MRISIEVPDSVAHLVQIQKEQPTLYAAPSISQQQSGLPDVRFWKPLAIVALALLGVFLVLSVASRINQEQHARQYHEQMEQLTQLEKSTEGAQAHLAYYLLSGASSEFDLMVEEQGKVEQTVQQLLARSQTPESRQALESLLSAQHRFKQFAQVVSEKRKQVDAGNASVAELQIFFLNQDPDQISSDMDKALTRVRKIETEN